MDDGDDEDYRARRAGDRAACGQAARDEWRGSQGRTVPFKPEEVESWCPAGDEDLVYAGAPSVFCRWWHLAEKDKTPVPVN